jgi:hypothetical protein
MNAPAISNAAVKSGRDSFWNMPTRGQVKSFSSTWIYVAGMLQYVTRRIRTAQPGVAALNHTLIPASPAFELDAAAADREVILGE